MKLSLLTCSLLAVAASAKTTIFLSSSGSPSEAPVSINAAEANEVLCHHLDVAHKGSKSSRNQIWDHIVKLDEGARKLALDQKANVERLFDGADVEPKNRLLVLVHGASDDELVPSDLHATHEMFASPSAPAFDALLGSYLDDLQRTLRIDDAAFSHFSSSFLQGLGALASGIEHVVEGTASWLMGSSSAVLEKVAGSSATWRNDLEDLVRNQSSAALDAVEAELEGLHALLDRITSGGAGQDDLAFQPLRFQSLGDVRATYGADSVEYAKVKKIVKQAIQELTDAFRSRSDAQGRAATVAFVINDAERQLTKRSALPGTLLDPFFGRDLSLDVGATRKSSKSKKPVNLVGSCFTEQSDLEKATGSCSGHGKAVQSSKGGRKCWRCQCQGTREKGRTTYWAGPACEKRDISTEFVLLGTTGLVLALLSLGSVYFVFSAGNEGLPGTLAGVTINLK